MSNRMLVPVTHLSKIFNITDRRVQQLASDGIIPKAERGQYPFIEAVQGYIKFLQERAFGKSDNMTDTHPAVLLVTAFFNPFRFVSD